jgi:hypothetical protein
VTVVGDRDAVDSVVLIAFDNRAGTMQRTGAFVAEARYGNTTDGEMSCGDAFDFSAMAGGVVQADDVGHGNAPSNEVMNQFGMRCHPKIRL